ncbi:MAG: ATPase [Bacillota bacterium]
MEVYRILDELEAELEEAARIPLTNKILIQEETLYKYIDKLRANLPEDIRQGQWIRKERQRILDDAEAEGQKIIENARSRVQELANETEILKLAEQNSQEILKKAKQQAQEITQGAFVYADDVMSQLEIQLEKQVSQVKEGRQQIRQTAGSKQTNIKKQTE